VRIFALARHVSHASSAFGGGLRGGHPRFVQPTFHHLPMRLNLFDKIRLRSAQSKRIHKSLKHGDSLFANREPRTASHSYRNATMGSTRVARRAGTKVASR
jgi:hypothetical protein